MVLSIDYAVHTHLRQLVADIKQGCFSRQMRDISLICSQLRVSLNTQHRLALLPNLDVYQEAEQLRKVPMFSKLEASKLKLLAFTSEAVEFHDQDILFTVNDPSDSAYVIMSGEVEILVDTEDGMVPVVTRGKNELIGEMAVLTNSPRSATLRAKGLVKTLRISDDAFLKMLSESPDVALDVMRQLSKKLAESHQQVENLQIRLQQYDSDA